MKHYITPNLPPLCWGYTAICLFPFGIFYRSFAESHLSVVRTHEEIHWKQQKEIFFLPGVSLLVWYLWYGIEYLIKLIRYRDHYYAYLSISFEQEANEHERNPGYLSERKSFAWFRFLFT